MTEVKVVYRKNLSKTKGLVRAACKKSGLIITNEYFGNGAKRESNLLTYDIIKNVLLPKSIEGLDGITSKRAIKNFNFENDDFFDDLTFDKALRFLTTKEGHTLLKSVIIFSDRRLCSSYDMDELAQFSKNRKVNHNWSSSIPVPGVCAEPATSFLMGSGNRKTKIGGSGM